MDGRFFTFVCEFRGTTHITQVSARDEQEAIRVWVSIIRRERPYGRASAAVAKSAEAGAGGSPPVPLVGLVNVWCVTGTCGGNLMLANIVETMSPPDVR